MTALAALGAPWWEYEPLRTPASPEPTPLPDPTSWPFADALLGLVEDERVPLFAAYVDASCRAHFEFI